MAPFQYSDYRDANTGSLLELLQQRGAISADAATRIGAVRAAATQQSGAAKAGAIQQAASIPGQIVDDTRQRAERARNQMVLVAGEVGRLAQQANGDPTVFKNGVSELARMGVVPKETAEHIYQRIDAGGPDALKSYAVFGPQVKAAAAEPFTLSPGQQRFGPDGKPLASVPESAPPAAGFTLAPGQQRFGPDGQPVASVPAVAPPPPKPTQYKVTVPGPDGKPVDKLVTEEELKAGVQTYEKPPAAEKPADPSAELTPEGVDYAATQIRVTNNMAVLNRMGEKTRAAVLNRVAEQAKELGQTPAVAIQRQAAYKADATALAQMRKMGSSAEAFESKALAQSDIVENLSSKVGRTQIPLLNDWLLAGKNRIEGDSETAQLFNAINTFSTEYAKIMEGSTGSVAASSDSARKAAERLISASQNQQTMSDVIKLMKREMKLTIGGYDATIGHITDRMGGSVPEQKSDPAGIR